MAVVGALQHALVNEKGYRPLDEPLQQRLGVRVPQGLAWAGMAGAWGSMASLGIVRADGLPLQTLEASVGAMHGLAEQLHAHAGRLVVTPAVGRSSEVQLGSFGVLLAVYESGSPPEAVATLRGARRGSMRSKRFTVAWTVDAPLRKVHGHKGLPFAMHPGRKWLEQVLRRS